MRRLAFGILVLSLAAPFVALAGWHRQSQQIKATRLALARLVGHSFPDFELSSAAGRTTARALLAERAAAFVFIRPDCEFCRRELRALNDNLWRFSLHAQIVGIDVSPTNSGQSSSLDYGFPVFRDVNHAFSSVASGNAVPVIVIADATGQVLHASLGELNAVELRTLFDSLTPNAAASVARGRGPSGRAFQSVKDQREP